MSVLICRLQHGLIVELPLAGGADHERPTKLVFAYGSNENVPADLIEKWLQKNAALPVVKRKDIFLVPDKVSDRLARDVRRRRRSKVKNVEVQP